MWQTLSLREKHTAGHHGAHKSQNSQNSGNGGKLHNVKVDRSSDKCLAQIRHATALEQSKYYDRNV